MLAMILSGPWIEDDVGDDHDCGDDDHDCGGTQPEAPWVNILKMMMMLNIVTQPEAIQVIMMMMMMMVMIMTMTHF